MDAFGNSRSILNTNASRFGQLTTLDFDHSGQIVSASIQVNKQCLADCDLTVAFIIFYAHIIKTQ